MGGLFEGWHPVVVLFIALLVFGPGKLGEIGGQLGRGVREFRDAVEGRSDAPIAPLPSGDGASEGRSPAREGDG